MSFNTRHDVVQLVYKRLGVVNKDTVDKVVHETFLVIADMLRENQEVRLHKFGSFSITKRKAFDAWDPIKEDYVNRPERYQPRFKFSDMLSRDIDHTIKDNNPSGK